MRRTLCCAVAVILTAGGAAGKIVITSPEDGATVGQLYPAQAKLATASRTEIDGYFDASARSQSLKCDGALPKPIDIAWTGGIGPCVVEVRRLPDRKLFFSAQTRNGKAQVDSLEIARTWEITVYDGTERATCVFKTLDQAPRLIALKGRIPNCRDIGGRIGLGGRRIRQGLVFRSAGLNDNPPQDYYEKDEILALYKAGKLAGMGSIGKRLDDKLRKGGTLHDEAKQNWLRKRWRKELGEVRMTEEQRVVNLSRWGFRSDLDLRSSVECWGMKGSPLGEGVAWFHCSYTCYDIGVMECNEKVFKVFLDPKNYPIVFHCIGGADRTGTVAMLLEALLGVDEDEMWRDYLATGFIGGVADPSHKKRFAKIFDGLRKYSGKTWADRAEGYFKTIGYSDKDIDFLRELLLEK